MSELKAIDPAARQHLALGFRRQLRESLHIVRRSAGLDHEFVALAANATA
ncbi:MAG: hypothetical protein R3E48_22350 [Burkholderiaceae bacterium]